MQGNLAIVVVLGVMLILLGVCFFLLRCWNMYLSQRTTPARSRQTPGPGAGNTFADGSWLEMQPVRVRTRRSRSVTTTSRPTEVPPRKKGNLHVTIDERPKLDEWSSAAANTPAQPAETPQQDAWAASASIPANPPSPVNMKPDSPAIPAGNWESVGAPADPVEPSQATEPPNNTTTDEWTWAGVQLENNPSGQDNQDNQDNQNSKNNQDNSATAGETIDWGKDSGVGAAPAATEW